MGLMYPPAGSAAFFAVVFIVIVIVTDSHTSATVQASFFYRGYIQSSRSSVYSLNYGCGPYFVVLQT